MECWCYDLDFRIWLGWSQDGRIHFAGEFADDAYVNEYDPDAGMEDYSWFADFDSITLSVDGDHSGYSYASDYRGVQTYDAIARVPSGPMVHLLGATDPNVDKQHWWMVHPPYARGGGGVLGENPTFWVIEFFATCFDRLNHLNPEETVVSQLSEGGIIGIGISVFDYDRENSHRHAMYYVGESLGMTDGLLLGLGASGDSAVQSVSWARIKASLQ